jgi:hydrogenase expression/formation protein HypD
VKTGDPLAASLLLRINRLVAELCAGRKSVNLMEVCGTHTMAISGFGIRRAVDRRLRLLSGPGCPVCVTAQEEIDACVELAQRPEVTITTFGDMLRVPGSAGSLEQARARGADVRVVYSTLDAVRMAQAERREFVFLGVGFETTIPTVAAALVAARDAGVRNLTVLPMFKTIPRALEYIATNERSLVDGFILPGHVSTIIGVHPYEFLRDKYRIPSCVVGFEALDVLQGIEMLLQQVRSEPKVEVQYRRSVKDEGNPAAVEVMTRVFEPCDASWRGIGVIPGSGLQMRPAYRQFDARERFEFRVGRPRRTACRCGDVMLGRIVPSECRLFGNRCTPEQPVGPCMVSSEGACAAWYKYERAD